jgi:hypothetical protein
MQDGQKQPPCIPFWNLLINQVVVDKVLRDEASCTMTPKPQRLVMPGSSKTQVN